MRVKFPNLRTADLVIDRIYKGGPGTLVNDDPISEIFPPIGKYPGAPNSGGFRLFSSQPKAGNRLCCLDSSQHEVEWPDMLDNTTGRLT